MTPPTWTSDDLRIVGDVVAGGLTLVLIKAFVEPLAVWVGQRGYRRLDDAVGDKLPDLFRGDADE